MLFFSRTIRNTRCAVGTGVQTCALPIFVFKKRRRHNYRRRNGHRQQHTILKIVAIGEEKKKAEPKKAAEPKAETAEPKAAAPKKAPAQKAPAKDAATKAAAHKAWARRRLHNGTKKIRTLDATRARLGKQST